MFSGLMKWLVDSKRNRTVDFLVIIILALLVWCLMLAPRSAAFFSQAAAQSSAVQSGGVVSPLPEQIAAPDKPVVRTYDVVVYGGTPSGIMSAVAASREGLKVAVLEPGRHLGGVVSGGLSFSDVWNPAVVGGLAKEFFLKVGAFYGTNKPVFAFEPHAAEAVFNQLAKVAGVDVYFQHRLKEKGGVQKTLSKITSVTTDDNSVFFAKIFIDSSYEGDLMAGAGVSYTVGREAQELFNESLAGVQPYSPHNNFRYSTPAFSMDGNLMPQILTGIPLKFGTGDKKTMAYNYRLCLTNDPTNLTPFPKPSDYDPTQFKVLIKWIFSLKQAEGNRRLIVDDILSLNNLPHDKFDLNNSGPVSTDFVGKSWAYPDSNHEQRVQIAGAHKNYQQSLLYFLSHDTSVPAEIRTDMKKWGLARDEFTDNANWPHQLYIREARRMIGDFILTQRDLQKELTKADTIGMGCYPIDSHSVQRIMLQNGFVENEGEFFVKISPYQIPYRVLTPRPSETGNLLVTVCVAASHVAYSSLRMEPQYMIMGQAAGYAASIAISQNSTVQSVNMAALQSLLKTQGAVLSLG